MRFPVSELNAKAECDEDSENALLVNEKAPKKERLESHKEFQNITDFNNTLDDLLNTLTNLQKFSSNGEVENVLNKIDNLVTHFPGPLTVQKLLKIDITPEYFEKFTESTYYLVLKTVASKFDHHFPFDESTEIHESVVNLFVVENYICFSESFQVLTQELQNNKNTGAILVLLQKLLMSDGLFDFLVRGTLEQNNEDNIIKAEVYSKYEAVIQNLMSLPNKIANVLEGKFPKMFESEIYCSLLLLNFIKTIEFLSEAVISNQICITDFNFQFLSLFLSKTVVYFNNGCSSDSLKKLIEIVTYWCTTDSIKQVCYKKIVCGIFTDLQKPAVEPLVIMILQNVDHQVYDINNILDGDLLKNKNWSFVLCTKVPLLLFFNENEISLIHNLLIYLAQASQSDLFQLVLNLLQVWSDKFSIKHTSVEHHLYIAKLIVVSTKYLEADKLTPSHKTTLLEKITLGIPIHFESGLDEIRVIGMTTGEVVCYFLHTCFNYPKEIALQFDFPKMSEKIHRLALNLKGLSAPTKKKERPDKNFAQLIKELISKFENSETLPYVPPERQFKKRFAGVTKNEIVVETCNIDRNKLMIIDDTDFQLDSDDDLEPYDTSNDVKVAKKLPPAYLRDLRDGLIETKDADIFTSSMEVCEKLILEQLPKDDASIGLELLEILLSLTPTYYVENFDTIVFQSCVAITCTYPAIYAEYLCKQFHADSGVYSICHRVLMLDILRESAKMLSSLQKDKNEQQHKKERENNPEAQSAEEMIRKRLESKTRRFIKHKHYVFETVNRFSEVAGSFFFPLVYGFGKSKFVPYSTPNDDDCVLLIYYLNALSAIMCCAQNCPIAPKMAKEIFSVSWFLRFHKDAKVRMATLSLLASAIFNVPKSILINDFVDILLEVRFWLDDMVDGLHAEINVECRTLAGQLLCLVEDVLKVDMELR